MNKLISLGPTVLMITYFILTLFQHKLKINQKQLMFILLVVSVLCVLFFVIDFKKSKEKKLALLDCVNYTIFVISSMLETFNIIDTYTYITLNLTVDAIDFFIDGIIRKRQN